MGRRGPLQVSAVKAHAAPDALAHHLAPKGEIPPHFNPIGRHIEILVSVTYRKVHRVPREKGNAVFSTRHVSTSSSS